MLARIRKTVEEREQGFTLIELLVVIIIIGILAAIAIPTFLNQREKGWVSQVESDLKNASVAAESYAVDRNGSYVGLNEAALASEGYNRTQDVTVTIQGTPTRQGYVLQGTHASMPDAASVWTYNSETGVISGP